MQKTEQGKKIYDGGAKVLMQNQLIKNVTQFGKEEAKKEVKPFVRSKELEDAIKKEEDVIELFPKRDLRAKWKEVDDIMRNIGFYLEEGNI